MKRLLILSLITTIFLSAAADTSGVNMFSAFSHNKDIESVYIGKAMIESAFAQSDSATIELIKGIDYVAIYSSSDKASVHTMRTDGFRIIQDSDLDLIVSTKEDDSGAVAIYGRPYPGESGMFSQIVMFITGNKTVTKMNFGGKMDLKAITTLYTN